MNCTHEDTLYKAFSESKGQTRYLHTACVRCKEIVEEVNDNRNTI